MKYFCAKKKYEIYYLLNDNVFMRQQIFYKAFGSFINKSYNCFAFRDDIIIE